MLATQKNYLTILFILGLPWAGAFLVTQRSLIRQPVTLLATKKPAGKGFSSAPKKGEPDRVPKDGSFECGCGSGNSYDACCGAFHSGSAVATEAEQILRSRFTAYKYRLPAYLVDTTFKFKTVTTGPDAISKNQQADMKRAVKVEKEELLKFIDSYDFSDLEVGHVSDKYMHDTKDSKGQSAQVEQQRISFTCNLRSRDGGRKLGKESDFLLNNVVVFKETSIFQRAGNLWYYLEADGDVVYDGESMSDAFDSPERQEAIAKGYADREQKRASSSSSSSGKKSSSPAPPAAVAAATETETKKAAPLPPPASKKAASESSSDDEMDKLRSALMDM